MYTQSCNKRSPLGQRKSGLIIHGISLIYEYIYDSKKKKKIPFTTVTA